uniref:Coiled-coil domain containing 150 n=1 Tax=Ornithorhynchus anatinus TaxID=9258 RepID=A0A6I8NNR0_ORNAN
MLESVLASHGKMQGALERVRAELGGRDLEIAGLRRERAQSLQKVQKLEAEVEQWQARLAVAEAQHAKEVEPLRQFLEASGSDNRKLALSLEQALQTNAGLQSRLDRLQDKLDRSQADLQQLAEEAKREAGLQAERLDALKKQFQAEREGARKASLRETAELKRALDEAGSRSADVARANGELRRRVSELEAALAGHKEKLKSQKSQLKRHQASGADRAQNLQRMKQIETELRRMELAKERYQKNYEQALSIQTFVTEMAQLQREMQALARNQHAAAARHRQRETHLEAERKLRRELESRCQGLEDMVRTLKRCKEATEHKLREARAESEEISASLEEAQRWFRSKFDGLRLELTRNRLQPLPREQVSDADERRAGQSALRRWEMKRQQQHPRCHRSSGAQAVRSPGSDGRRPPPPPPPPNPAAPRPTV